MPAAETQRETTTGMSSVLRLMVVANRPDTGPGAWARKRADAVHPALPSVGASLRAPGRPGKREQARQSRTSR